MVFLDTRYIGTVVGSVLFLLSRTTRAVFTTIDQNIVVIIHVVQQLSIMDEPSTVGEKTFRATSVEIKTFTSTA